MQGTSDKPSFHFRDSACVTSQYLGVALARDVLYQLARADVRNNASNCEQDSQHAAVCERLPAEEPTEQDNAARFEVTDNCATQRAALIDDHEL